MSGRVVLGDKPLTNGVVIFHADAAKGKVSGVASTAGAGGTSGTSPAGGAATTTGAAAGGGVGARLCA